MLKTHLTKTTLLLLIALMISIKSFAAATDDFVIRVKTDFPGTSTNNEFTIQTTGSGYNYNIDCDNDGTFEITAQSGNYVCTYGSPGFKFIRIEDNNGDGSGFPRVYYDNTGDHRKLIDVVQWGTGKWTSMAGAFRGAQNMTASATDVPDLSLVTDLSNMFRFATIANPNTSAWDVSQVTTFHSMFRSATNANPDTSNWDTSSAQIMTNMFWNATSVNPDVSSWDVSGVTDMTLMFGNVTLPTATYDNLLVTFESQLVQNNVTLDGGNSKFCSLPAQISHSNLMADHLWAVNDGGICAPSDPVNNFVFTVVTYNSGDPADASTFTIPTTGVGYKYNVDCNDDGSFEATGLTGDYVCDYSALGGPGTYTIRIEDGVGDGTGFPRVKFGQGIPEGLEIIELNNWGTGLWDSMESAFASTHLMQILANDAPNLSNVTDVSKMFANAELANPDTSLWDTSNIFNMSQMFFGAWDANPDTGNWDTSNVTDMSFMFMQAFDAQPDTSNWDTGEVKFMEGMFLDASLADPVMSSWNIGNVSDMTNMFLGVTLSTSNYDTALINFASQSVLQGINFHGGNSKYCAIAAHDMLEQNDNWTITDGGICPPPTPTIAPDLTAATDNATVNGPSDSDNFTSFPLLAFDVVCSLSGNTINLYLDAPVGPPVIEATQVCSSAGVQTINLTAATRFGERYIQYTEESSNGESGASPYLFVFVLASPDDFVFRVTSNSPGTSADDEFTIPTHGTGYNYNVDCNNDGINEATAQTSDYTCNYQGINGTYRIRIRDNSGVGAGFPRIYFNNGGDKDKIDYIVEWGTGIWTSMENAFYGTTNINNVSSLSGIPDFSQVSSMKAMFKNSMINSIRSTDWDTSNVTDMSEMFSGAENIDMDTSLWDVSNVTNMHAMFAETTLASPDTYNWDTSSVQDMSNMFDEAISANPDTSDWIMTSVTTLKFMFGGASLADPDTSLWDTSNVTNMSSMFSGATFANPDTSLWNTENVTNMSSMFRGATIANPDTSLWITNSVTNMTSMFTDATSANPNTTNWNTENVTGMSRMFKGAIAADPDTSLWDTGIVYSMTSMFEGASMANPDTSLWITLNTVFLSDMFKNASIANPDTSLWDTQNVLLMGGMFANATNANPNTSNWDISNVQNMSLMFSNVTLPTHSYDAMLIGFATQTLQPSINFDGGNSKYCSQGAQDARTSLEVNDGWMITDGGYIEDCDIIFSNGFE